LRDICAMILPPAVQPWLDDLRTAACFATRLPIPHSPEAVNMARAMRLLPLVGALVGLVLGLLLLALLRLGVPPLAAAVLTLGAGAALTGALHEDGLADMADGFGGGRDRDAKLAIMRDSRLGTYGGLALVTAFAAKAALLAALPAAQLVGALVAAHALGRAAIPALARALPQARRDGLAAAAGAPEPGAVTLAAALGVAVALLALPFGTALLACIMAALGVAATGWLARRQIGGVTGDVLGGAEQVAEILVLLVVAVRVA
jgi:adenosylcobinamide-GDP ribazoletransferase